MCVCVYLAKLCRILVPLPAPSAVETQNPNHWISREVSFKVYILNFISVTLKVLALSVHLLKYWWG